MSFKLFIYYCAICGGWAAFLTWAFVTVAQLHSITWVTVQTALIAAILGAMLAGAIGSVDALLNSVGSQRFLRVGVCVAFGLVGGLFCGLIAEAIRQGLIYLTNFNGMPRFPGWILCGVIIGFSVGAFDLAQALFTGKPLRASIKKIMNGVLGGLVGGFIGGAMLDIIYLTGAKGHSVLATGFVILGMCIGLLVGLAQVILKEAWIRVEQGFRPGRELMLVKAETVIGRAEGSDLGLFGDNGVERKHARILLNEGRYILYDEETPGGTFVNDRRISGPTPLRSGDLIRVGRNVIVFGERQKRPA